MSSSSRKKNAVRRKVATSGRNNNSSGGVEFEAVQTAPNSTDSDTFSYEDVSDLSTVTPAIKRLGKDASRTAIRSAVSAAAAAAKDCGYKPDSGKRAVDVREVVAQRTSKNHGINTNDERVGGAATRRRQRPRVEVATTTTTTTAPPQPSPAKATATEEPKSVDEHSAATGDANKATTMKNNNSSNSNNNNNYSNNKRTANGTTSGTSKSAKSAIFEADAGDDSTESEETDVLTGRRLELLGGGGDGGGKNGVGSAKKNDAPARENGFTSKSMAGEGRAGVAGEKRKRTLANSSEEQAAADGHKEGRESRSISAAAVASGNKEGRESRGSSAAAAAAEARLATKMPPYPRIDFKPSSNATTLKKVLQEAVAAEIQGLVRERGKDPTCTAAVKTCEAVSKELMTQAWDISIGLEIVRTLDLEEARRMLQEERAKLARYEEEERQWDLEEVRLLKMAEDNRRAEAAAQCLDTRPVEERFSLGQFGQHHDPSGSIAGLEDGDDASSVHSEGLGTAKQTSDLLLAATEDMILKAGAIGRGLREMGAEVAEAQETKEVLVREFKKYTLRNYPNVDDPKAGIAAMLS